MTPTSSNFTIEPGTLAHLRAVMPSRPLEFNEALRIAELQANRLLEIAHITDGPVPSELVTELPRIHIDHCGLLTSGMSYWNGQMWVICLHRDEPHTRRRFTLFHEFKHIIDHGSPGMAGDHATMHGEDSPAVRQVADYFAACTLMPKRLVKRAWGERIQRTSDLAELFDVSLQAMDIRLLQLGLIDPRARCAPPRASQYRHPQRRSYFRQQPKHTPCATEGAVV